MIQVIETNDGKSGKKSVTMLDIQQGQQQHTSSISKK
jgi:hypothetical protein